MNGRAVLQGGISTPSPGASRPRRMREGKAMGSGKVAITAAAARLTADIDRLVHDCFYISLAIQIGYPVVTAGGAEGRR